MWECAYDAQTVQNVLYSCTQCSRISSRSTASLNWMSSFSERKESNKDLVLTTKLWNACLPTTLLLNSGNKVLLAYGISTRVIEVPYCISLQVPETTWSEETERCPSPNVLWLPSEWQNKNHSSSFNLWAKACVKITLIVDTLVAIQKWDESFFLQLWHHDTWPHFICYLPWDLWDFKRE